MALDFDKIREEYEKLQNQGNAGGGDFVNNFFQIPEGESAVRILPGKDDDTLFYAGTAIHRIPTGDGQTKNYHCRKVHGEECPLCEAYYALWKPPYSNEELAREVKPRNRYYMNIVDRTTGEVKILSVGIILHTKIINTLMDEDYGDVTDLDTGHDFKIKKIMEGKWPKYDQTAFRPKSTSAGFKKDVAVWMESLHDIHALVKLEDYEELKQVAQNLLVTGQGGGAPAVKASAETSNESVSKPVATEADFLKRLNKDD